MPQAEAATKFATLCKKNIHGYIPTCHTGIHANQIYTPPGDLDLTIDIPKGSAHSLRELDLAGGLALVGAHLLHHRKFFTFTLTDLSSKWLEFSSTCLLLRLYFAIVSHCVLRSVPSTCPWQHSNQLRAYSLPQP